MQDEHIRNINGVILGDYIKFEDESSIYVDGHCLKYEEDDYFERAMKENVGLRSSAGHHSFPLLWMMSVNPVYANVDMDEISSLFPD